MNDFPSRAVIDSICRKYPSGSRIELIRMDDPYTKLVPGDRGTVEFVDDIGTIFCRWDSGSSLGIAYGRDQVVLIKETDND